MKQVGEVKINVLEIIFKAMNWWTTKLRYKMALEAFAVKESSNKWCKIKKIWINEVLTASKSVDKYFFLVLNDCLTY